MSQDRSRRSSSPYQKYKRIQATQSRLANGQPSDPLAHAMAAQVFLRVSRVAVLDGAGPHFDEAGSEMFRPVAGPLQEGGTAVLPPSGEEFGLVLASTNNDGSRNSRKRVSSEPKVGDWVHLAAGHTDVETTLEQPSAALYRGRRYGRDRVCEAHHV